MDEYKTLHERLNAEGYEIVGVYPNHNLPEGLTDLSLNIARGKYDSIRIIPADIVMQETEWIPVEQYHIAYATPSETEKKSREGEGPFATLTSILCKHKDDHEEEYVPIH